MSTISTSTLKSLFNPRTFQTLAAGTLLGSCIWGSFVAGVIAYKTLPRQLLLIPYTIAICYFTFNVYTSAAMLANWLYYHPGTLSSMFNSSTIRNSNVFNAWTIALGFIGNSLVNLFIILPWTRRLMYKRHRMEREEGKSYSDPNASPEMKKLTSQFGAAHGTSSVINLAYLAAVMFHSAWLATYGF